MRIYDNRNNNKRTMSCHYCWREGHSKNRCPHLKKHWQDNKHLTKDELSDYDNLNIDHSMWERPTRFGSNTYAQFKARKQFLAHYTYASKTFGSTVTKPKKKRKSSCGFCGRATHTRRNCTHMDKFVEILNVANNNYREQWYDKFVTQMGFGTGALIQTNRGVGIVTKLDLDTVMFTNTLSVWGDYHTVLGVELMVNENRIIPRRNNMFKGTDHYGWGDAINYTFFSNWANIESIMSPSPNPVDKEWFLAQQPQFDWVVKKRSAQQIWREVGERVRLFHPDSAEELDIKLKRILGKGARI